MKRLYIPIDGRVLSVPVLTSDHLRVLGQIRSGILPDGSDDLIADLYNLGLLDGGLHGWKN